jgi:hypothetical protein
VVVPAPHPWRTEGKGPNEVARRALLAFVTAPQVLLDSGVGGAGADEGQARVNRFVVIAPCPPRHPQPDAVLLEIHRGFVIEASLRLGPGPRLGSSGEEVHKAVGLVVVLAVYGVDRGPRSRTSLFCLICCSYGCSC